MRFSDKRVSDKPGGTVYCVLSSDCSTLKVLVCVFVSSDNLQNTGGGADLCRPLPFLQLIFLGKMRNTINQVPLHSGISSPVLHILCVAYTCIVVAHNSLQRNLLCGMRRHVCC